MIQGCTDTGKDGWEWNLHIYTKLDDFFTVSYIHTEAIFDHEKTYKKTIYQGLWWPFAVTVKIVKFFALISDMFFLSYH